MDLGGAGASDAGRLRKTPRDNGDKTVRGLILSADLSEVIADVTGTDRRQLFEEFFKRTDN